MTGLNYDPEYFKAIGSPPKGPRADPPTTAHELRSNIENTIRIFVTNSPYPSGIKETVYKVKSLDGTEIEVTRFACEETLASEKPTPAVVYFHGGGFVACTVPPFAPQIARFANDSKLPYFAVDYRLAPEYPAPAAFEDAWAAIQFVSNSAVELNVDPARIALYGDSAGGGLAAGAALMARDRHLDPPIAKQILIYPMLDDRYNLKDDDPYLEVLAMRPAGAKVAWDAYLSKLREGDDAQALSYAVPARAATLKGLPSTYIDIGSLDLFRDESLRYANRLADEHVEVEFHLWPGLPHGFDGLRELSWYTRATESRVSALKRM
ncbi:hypothetical protein FPSE_04673 [Fusarium pseudograminearum CS3096]|uniref:Alpha/beta hydrolase fold-3 domain-containing protein n=1 Tax=Fusarium pseudograminearum (strain CS3096) TaxID=1028729 RepID=K3W116_FUSPC|nr:hypothetical protein FPSE_04673 [Fusarium pseudograminearum CS3096]EKJ75115.1 hypothetical protein FPSE_04673 [Fusarium pseudograminearum CS3096]